MKNLLFLIFLFQSIALNSQKVYASGQNNSKQEKPSVPEIAHKNATKVKLTPIVFAGNRYVVEADGLEISDGKAAMADFLERGLPFTAVFGGNDNLALGAIAALKERGLDVPREVSVVGFDGIDAALHSHPPLATMKVSRQRLAEQAVARIVSACAGTVPTNMTGRLSSKWIEGSTLAAAKGPL